tara:strand:+ start:325 stop:1635 length:1311 start_codon:yes stop_codon:yes gene_type:complete
MSLKEYFQTSTAEPQLSVEEHETVIIATQETVDEIEVGFEDIKRLELANDHLLALESIVSDIEQVTERDRRLVQLTTDSILADFDLNHQHIFGSLESDESATISLEGVGEFISNIWKAIVRTVKRVWEAILAFFGRIKDQSERLKKQNEKMRERMRAVAGKSMVTRQVELERDADQIAIDGRVPKNGKEIVDNLRVMAQQVDVVYNDYAKVLVDTGRALESAIVKFDLEKPEESLRKVVEASNKLSMDAIRASTAKMGNGKIKDKRWPDKEVIGGAHLMGGKNLFHITSSVKPKEDNVLALSEISRKREFIFDKTSDKGHKVVTAKIATVTSEEGVEIAQLNKQIIETIASFDKEKKSVDKVRRDLEKAGDVLEKRAKKASTEVPDNTGTYVQEALKFVTSYSQWAARPMVDMGSHFYKVVRATTTVCNKSADNYE